MAAKSPTEERERLARAAFRAALIGLALTALLGTFLRGAMVFPISGINTRNFVHAHSHVAFLGWIFNGFFALSLAHFAPDSLLKPLRRLFWCMQVALAGMLVAFPFQGYGAVAISFSTLHMAATARFAWLLWRQPALAGRSAWHLKTALAFLLLSGLGPLALGPLSAMGMRDHPAYSLTLFLYLHFQYNGWFTFFPLALAEKLSRPAGIAPPACLPLLAVGTVLTFAQSTLWLQPPLWVNGVAATGGVLQLIGALLAWKQYGGALPKLATGPRRLLQLAALLFFLKCVLHLAIVIPGLGPLSQDRSVVLAFLHLVFLGITTPIVLAAGIGQGWLPWNRITKCSLLLFLAGSAASQLVSAATPFLTVRQASQVPTVLLAAAVATLAGALCTLFSAFSRGMPSYRSRTNPDPGSNVST
ncbi:hypothetical protein [Nibricoccus sp. IMCC34717]|uniref:hypothetical protein n=1 Tax=Nibricoccus sp. IMCC34717 TaxID=3034021 RepID=UPI00384A4798